MVEYGDPLARSLNTREVVVKLRKDIILGKFKPGTRLIEAKLAEQLGTSRAPVRTAFQLLAQEGLVLNLPNGGTEVIGCTIKNIIDMFDLRLIMERHAVQSALDSTSFNYRPLFDAMEIFDEHKKKSINNEITSYDTSYLDITFHRSLILMSDNSPLLVAWNTMANTVQAILEITNMTSSTFEEFYNDHRKLAEMVIQKSPACIGELEFHITKAKGIIVERIENNME